MAGPVLVSGDAAYEDARAIWNGDIDRRPAVVARCTSAADVAAALAYGQEEGLEITVRGGGHSYAGAWLTDDGLMIDLSRMHDVHVDPGARIARCGGGATWADVDGATQQFGLVVPGMISHTGIGGPTLGGGIGWLTRRHGLVIDNLIAAEVVLADGAIVRASAEEHPDLFWALRGGGGNFGVVTAFEYRLHPIGPEIRFGLFFWPLDQTAEALRLSRDTIHGLNRDATGFIAPLNAPPESFVPEEHHLRPGTVLIIVGFGSAEEHAALVAPVREALPPLFELVTPHALRGAAAGPR